jgi:hypothetical protein
MSSIIATTSQINHLGAIHMTFTTLKINDNIMTGRFDESLSYSCITKDKQVESIGYTDQPLHKTIMPMKFHHDGISYFITKHRGNTLKCWAGDVFKVKEIKSFELFA